MCVAVPGHWWAVRFLDPLKSLFTGTSLLVNCYLGNKFQKNQAGPPPFSCRIVLFYFKRGRGTKMGAMWAWMGANMQRFAADIHINFIQEGVHSPHSYILEV